jgi:hypothetical protein
MTDTVEFQNMLSKYFITFLRQCGEVEDNDDCTPDLMNGLIVNWDNPANKEVFNGMVDGFMKATSVKAVKKAVKKAKRKAKDPSAPKKNKSSYIFYCLDARSVMEQTFGYRQRKVCSLGSERQRKICRGYENIHTT